MLARGKSGGRRILLEIASANAVDASAARRVMGPAARNFARLAG